MSLGAKEWWGLQNALQLVFHFLNFSGMFLAV